MTVRREEVPAVVRSRGEGDLASFVLPILLSTSQRGRNESSSGGERSMTSMRHWIRTAGLGLAAVLIAVPASAQIVQSAHFGIGAFYPRGFDSRDANDTLVADLTTAEPLAFDIGQFTSVTFFGEWIVELGP